jgi:hypothetical protein
VTSSQRTVYATLSGSTGFHVEPKMINREAVSPSARTRRHCHATALYVGELAMACYARVLPRRGLVETLAATRLATPAQSDRHAEVTAHGAVQERAAAEGAASPLANRATTTRVPTPTQLRDSASRIPALQTAKPVVGTGRAGPDLCGRVSIRIRASLLDSAVGGRLSESAGRRRSGSRSAQALGDGQPVSRYLPAGRTIPLEFAN